MCSKVNGEEEKESTVSHLYSAYHPPIPSRRWKSPVFPFLMLGSCFFTLNYPNIAREHEPKGNENLSDAACRGDPARCG